MQFLVDTAGDFIILFRENHKLVGLVEAVNHGIGHQHAYEEHHEAVNEFLYIVQDEERGSHDDEVAEHIDFAVGDVAVFAHHEGDDVEAAGIAAPVDGNAGPQGPERGADDDAHEHVVHQRFGEDHLCDVKEDRDDERAYQGVDAEPGAQDFPSDCDEDGVKHESGKADGDFGGKKGDGGDAGHATACDLERSHECCPSDDKNCQTDGDEKVVFDLCENLLAGNHNG